MGKKQKLSPETRQRMSRKKGTSSSDMSVYLSSAEESVRCKDNKELSVYKSSEEYFEYCCDPCSNSGSHVEAQGFCKNCEVYLCDMCYRSHQLGKTSRRHILLDKDKMPNRSVKLCNPCKTEGDKLEAVGYCVDCGDYLCSKCYGCHSKNTSSRKHNLIEKDKMLRSTDNTLTSTVAKMSIRKQKSGSQMNEEEYTFIRDINVKANTDKKGCFIKGMTLVTTNTLILTDCNNESLKLIDLESTEMKDSLRLQAAPLGLTTISSDQVAVVLYNKCKIQIISISGGLSVLQTINTNGECVDVKYMNEKLYVSFWQPVKFQIFQLTGEVIKTINPDSSVLKHCTLPNNTAVTPDENMIYISDWKRNSVLCTNMNGDMISKYESEVDRPCGIILSPVGSVYVCTKQHVVYKMTSDLSVAIEILGSRNGLWFPTEICFNAEKQHLYISSGSQDVKHCNFIKVFQWK